MTAPAVRCRYCPALIVWARTEKAKAACFDAEPSPKGRWLLVGGGAVYIRPGEEKPGQELRESHWATCPGAKRARAEHPRKSP